MANVGRPPLAPKIVSALEAAGYVDAADFVRTITSLPPRTLTPTERFLADVRAQVTGQPVYFTCESDEEAIERGAMLARTVPPVGVRGRKYLVKRRGARLEVSLG